MSHPTIHNLRTLRRLDRRSPKIDAAAILAVSIGEATFCQPIAPSTDPRPSCTKPVTALRIEDYAPKQPARLSFDATDIFTLSLTAHPWQAKAIEKAG